MANDSWDGISLPGEEEVTFGAAILGDRLDEGRARPLARIDDAFTCPLGGPTQILGLLQLLMIEKDDGGLAHRGGEEPAGRLEGDEAERTRHAPGGCFFSGGRGGHLVRRCRNRRRKRGGQQTRRICLCGWQDERLPPRR